MGRKPASILAGLAMVGATLVGCESSRPFQGPRMSGPSTASTATPTPGWNSPTGVAGRPAGSVPGSTAQQTPPGQWSTPGQQPVIARPTPPGSATVGSGGTPGTSPNHP